MSHYPGYPPPGQQPQQPPQQRSYPPPPGGGGGYGGGPQFQAQPPPPGGPPAMGSFPGRPNPPGMGMRMGMPPGPPPPGGGGGMQPMQPPAPGNVGFRPPPAPPMNGGGGMANLQQSMGAMSMGQGANNRNPGPPSNTFQAAPQPPQMFSPPGAPQIGVGFNKPSAPPPMQPPGGPPAAAAPNFYQQTPNQGGGPTNFNPMNPMSAPNAPQNDVHPGAGVGVGGVAQPQLQENIDFNVQIPKRLLRLSSTHIPQSVSMVNSTKLPLGAVIRPLAPPGPEEEDVDVVNPGAAGIIRCKRCRLYINAFVSWFENGRRWRCNICSQVNDCPSAYFCHLDAQNQRRDKLQRPELSKGVVEFVAPSEYMVRPPQPPSYFFLIDVSLTAVRSGVLASVANAIKRSLDDLPGESRTQVGFITFDDSVHYYCLKAGLSHPQMLVVADLKELFVPAPDDLLVNLKDSRDVVESFLDNLPTMFAHNQATDACLGPALKAAFTVTKNVGGKMCVFQSTLPNVGDGALKPRENYRMMGTPEEMKLIKPDMTWYKDTAVEFCRAQISVDLFLFPYQYIDAAALTQLCENTAGTMNTYPMFNPTTDGPRFESDLIKNLTRNTAFEAVMRVRCTKGMRISNFSGNYFIRGTDLLALPNCTSDSSFGFHITHDEQSINNNVVTIQSALLYTSCTGQRRIRVMTQAVPVTSILSEYINGVDINTVSNIFAKQALTVALKTNLDTARTRLLQTCMDIVRNVKQGDRRSSAAYPGGPPNQPQQPTNGEDDKEMPDSLKLFPLYTMALIKNIVFRGGTDIHPDERVQAMQYLNTMWVSDSQYFIYPRMFSIHDMDSQAGKMSTSTSTAESDEVEAEDDSNLFAGRNKVILPKVANLSIDRLSSDGIFLLDNGLDMFLWVGRSVDPAVMSSLFGVESFEGMDPSQIELRQDGSDHASRLHAIVTALRDEKNTVPKVNIIREGDDAKEQRFFWYLVEDRASFQGGTYNYPEFMQLVNKQGAQAGAGPPGMPGGAPQMAPRGRVPPPPGPPGRGPPPPPGGHHMNGTMPGQMRAQPPGPPGGMPPPPMPMQASGGHGGMAPPPMRGGMPPPPMQGGGGPPPTPPSSYNAPPPPSSSSSSSNMPPPPAAPSYSAPPPPPRGVGGPPSRQAPPPPNMSYNKMPMPPGPPSSQPPPPHQQQQHHQQPPPPAARGGYPPPPPPPSNGMNNRYRGY